MKIHARNLGCAGLVLGALMAWDATVMTAGSLPGTEVRRLSAQEARRNHQDEERMFMAARRALNREEFDRAAELFQALREKYPLSRALNYGRFVPDSYYWEAFGRYRQGNLDEALMLLDLLRVYREAAQQYREDGVWRPGRLYNDVRELRARIQRQLAEQGDPDAAEEVLRHSEAVLAMDSAEVLEMQRHFAEEMAHLQARLEEQRARLTPDTAAYSEMERQFEARIREAQDAMTVQQAQLERELQRSVERYRAQLDSAAALGIPGREYQPYMDALVRQRSEEALMAYVQANRELSQLADTAAAADIRSRLLRAQLEDQLAYLGAAFPGWMGEAPHPECEDALIQQEALTSLLRLETDAMPTVRDMLKRDDDCSAHLRYLALNWLPHEGTGEARELLTEVARTHADAQTRRWAVTALADFADPETAETLASILQESGDREIQNAAISGLYRHPSDGTHQLLVEFAADRSKPEELRKVVAMGLARRVSADSARTVFHRLDSEVQLDFLGALAERVRTGELRVSWLFPLIDDPNTPDEMRLSLWKVWSLQPVLNLSLNFLDELYGDLDSAELRDELLYSLYLKAQSDEERVPGAADRIIEKMIDLAREETDPEVRKRAVYWLGRTGSERAAEFLMEILRERSSGLPGQPN